MNHNILAIESFYEFKKICRSILYRIFIILTPLGLILYQFTSLLRENSGNFIQDFYLFSIAWPSQALPSAIAFKSAYYFNIIQLLFIVFSITNDLRISRFNTRGALLPRPQGNGEIITGNFLGYLLAITILNWLTFSIAIIFNLILFSHSFNFLYYLFYWSTLTFPATIYFLGISHFVIRLVHNPGISFITLFFLLGGIIYWNDIVYGLLDPSARQIPNMFSEFTGHVNLGNYLLQRGNILLTGFGFLTLSVILYPRIPNSTSLFKKNLSISCLLLILAIGLILISMDRITMTSNTRKNYQITYEKYSTYPKVKIIQNDLHVTEMPNGDISVSSKMAIINNTPNEIPLILYLNPGLKINSIMINEKKIPFQRNHQVIFINEQLESDKIYRVIIEYKGNIETSLCFLNIPRSTYNSPSVNTHSIYHYGATPSFCKKNYKLLTPECVWYPMNTMPHDLSGYRNTNFTRYSLEVEHAPHLTAISQGEIIKKENGKTCFHFTHDMPGISLCIGEYTKKEIIIDSTRLALYCLPSHEYLLEKYKNEPEKIAKSLQYNKHILENNECIQTTEYAQQVDWGENIYDPIQQYPYRWFILLEVPCHFHYTFQYRLTGTKEQGGIIFLPEKLYSIKDYQYRLPKNEEEKKYMSHLGITKDIKITLQTGECDIRPILRGQTSFISSSKYPIIHSIFSNMMFKNPPHLTNSEYEFHTIKYLKKNSLKDALQDHSLSPAQLNNIIQKKAEELYMHLTLQIKEKDIREFYINFLRNNLFQESTLEELFHQFYQTFGIKLDSLVENWYNRAQLPLFEIRNTHAIKVEEMDSLYAICSFCIFNKSNIPGIVVTDDYQGWIIPPHEAREIRTRSTNNISWMKNFSITTPLAQNLPATINFQLENPNNINVDKTTGSFKLDTTLFSKNKNEIIVDNEDSGFKIVKAKGFNILSLFRKDNIKQKRYHKYFTEDKWLPTINEHFYGSPIRSALYKSAGSGNQKVEWNTLLPEEGEYEVFFYYSQLFKPTAKNKNYIIQFSMAKKNMKLLFSQKKKKPDGSL